MSKFSFKYIKNLVVRLFTDEKFKETVGNIIFESDTPLAKLFDVCLMGFIILSVLIVIVESLLPPSFSPYLHVLEWIFTLFFSVEYALRLYCAKDRRHYFFSFFGMIDLLATLPTYLSFFISGAHGLMVIRIFRIIRVFRVFKLFNFLSEGHLLLQSLKESSRKIIVFFLFVLLLVISIGTIMYLVESGEPDSNFTSIPKGIYWAVVTMTTVGYGDVTPTTATGQFLSAVVMLLGYTILAVPTGIVSASMISQNQKDPGQVCPHCHKVGHDINAAFCKYCGRQLDRKSAETPDNDKRTQEGEIIE
ncbi:MAG: ion transporter [Paludibacteraceae bacterium]|nr:ion transporter [Paludibacteraceae bacterium]